MQYRHYLLLSLVAAALLLLPDMACSQTLNIDAPSAVRELWTLKSTDGRSHDIEAIALSRSGNASTLYVLERNSEPMPSKSKDIDLLLWGLDLNGKVLHKEFIKKMPNREPVRAIIVPLPAPLQGAIIVGMFEAQYGWSFLRVDDSGKITKSKPLAGDAFRGAVLSPDSESVLLAGHLGKAALMWKTDLDGNVLWKKTYKPKAATDDTMYSDLASIALTDQEGGVVVAGEFRDTLNKFGFGKASIWLMQCDKAGNVLSETTFPGRIPSICAVGKEQFAIMYDASFVLQIDCRVRLVAPNLQERWEKKADFTGTLIVDAPAISPIPANRGFVLAGGNSISNKNIVRKECRFLQYNANGQLVSSTSIPITQGAFPLPRVVCGSDRAYVAMQTKGESPYDTHEASIFEILLHKEDQ